MKHYEHPQLIERKDKKPLNELRTRGNTIVIFECEKCKKHEEFAYNKFYRAKRKICNNCIREESKEKSRKRMNKNWEDENYRKEISKKVSEGQKKSWQTKKRKKPQKEKYYWELKESLKEEGYCLVTSLDEYLYNNAYIDYQCPIGHYGKTTYKRWKNGCDRCKECKKQSEEKKLYKAAKLSGFELKEIKDSTVVVKCENDHESEILKYNLCKIQGCGQCDHQGRSSKEEEIICNFLDNLDVNYINNTRQIIPPYELDFFLPDYNIGIEYDGYPWHTEMYGKGKNSHRLKTILCERNNIRLIHIFYDELLFDQDKILNRLKYILGKEEIKIYARNCSIGEITSSQARELCEEYHIQGYQTSSIRLGLFYNDELISIMTFRRYEKDVDKNWELVRFASKYNIVGGAGKLLEYFKRNYSWERIITYADRRWSQGNLYTKIGFKFQGYTKPDYFYINTKSKDKRREHRFNYRKKNLKGYEDYGDTEKEIMNNLGYTIIWGCGHIRFTLENKNPR